MIRFDRYLDREWINAILTTQLMYLSFTYMMGETPLSAIGVLPIEFNTAVLQFCILMAFFTFFCVMFDITSKTFRWCIDEIIEWGKLADDAMGNPLEGYTKYEPQMTDLREAVDVEVQREFELGEHKGTKYKAVEREGEVVIYENE